MKNIKTFLVTCLVLIALIVAGFILYATSHLSGKDAVSEQMEKTGGPVGLVGNDKDSHGCIASAGYIWSELLQECIRPFEKGVKLLGIDSDDAVYAAYLVFDADQSKVEVFLPTEDQHPILCKDVIGLDEVVWTSSEPGAPVVQKSDGKLQVLLDGTCAFVEE